MTPPPYCRCNRTWATLLEFTAARGWKLDYTPSGQLVLRKYGSVVFAPAPNAPRDAFLELIDRLGWIDGAMSTCRERRP